MRNVFVWLMLLVMTVMTMAPGAYAEGPIIMAGYGDKDTKQVWAENDFFARMEEVTGVKLALQQYTSKDAWEKAKDDMLAGGELPDVLFKANLTPQETMAMYEAGVLIDLRPYLEENAPNLWALLQEHPEWLLDITLPDGAIVALPYIDQVQYNNLMWINQDWLKRLDLEMPTTADELLTVLRAFKNNDCNRNGKDNDEIPLCFSSMWDLRFLAHAFGVNANDYYVTLNNDGKVTEYLTTQANYDFIKWLKQLYDEGLMDLNGFTNLNSINNKKSDSAPIVYGVMLISTPAERVHSSSLDQYVTLPPLKHEGTQIYRDLTGDIIRGTFAITSACEDPAKMLQWVDTLYTETGFILAEVGKDGEEFLWVDEDSWRWIDTSETLLTRTLPQSTIGAGATVPGIDWYEFQMKVDEKETVRILEEMLKYKGYDSLPYPLVWLSEKDQKRVDELILKIGAYAEQQMVWFIAGDDPLNDRTWKEFCDTVYDLGMQEMLDIWQKAADQRAATEKLINQQPEAQPAMENEN